MPDEKDSPLQAFFGYPQVFREYKLNQENVSSVDVPFIYSFLLKYTLEKPFNSIPGYPLSI